MWQTSSWRALAHRFPSFATITNYAEFGGLMAYGASLRSLLIRWTSFVKRILDGARPGDPPVEQPTKIELVINLKTAKRLASAFRQRCSPVPTT